MENQQRAGRVGSSEFTDPIKAPRGFKSFDANTSNPVLLVGRRTTIGNFARCLGYLHGCELLGANGAKVVSRVVFELSERRNND